MPAVPMMKAFFWSRGANERHASAMTTALSPLSRMLITAISKSAIQVSGLPKAASIAELLRRMRWSPHATSPALPGPVAGITPGLRQPYGELTSRYSHRRAFWERDGERVAEAVCILGERDLCVVQLRDLLDDRKPKTTAVGMTAEEPVKPLEYALALLERNDRSVVADRYARRVDGDSHGYAAIVARIANCVVEQVFDELGETRCVAANHRMRLDAIEAEIDVLTVRFGHPCGRHVERELRQVDWRELELLHRRRLVPRKRQELRDEPRHPFDAGIQMGDRLPGLRR